MSAGGIGGGFRDFVHKVEDGAEVVAHKVEDAAEGVANKVADAAAKVIRGSARTVRTEPAPPSAPRAGGPVRAPDLGKPDVLDKVGTAPVISIFTNSGALRDSKIDDHRGAAAVTAAMTEPLATPPGSQPFGKTVVFRPALANTNPSAAYLFRLARYTDKLLVASSYAKPGEDLTPRPVDEIYGQKVPPELKGKIWVTGDPDSRVLVPWPKLAELFEKELDAMDGSAFLGGGSAENAGVTVVSYSSGGAEAVATRRRLEQEGRPGVIGKLVNVSTPMRGAPLPSNAFGGRIIDALKPFSQHVPVGTRQLTPEYMKTQFSDKDQSYVDLAISNSLDVGGPYLDNARPIMKALNKAQHANPLNPTRDVPNDGWVAQSSMEFGKDILRLDRAYDHPGMGEDPRIIDDIARRLAGTK